MENNVKQNFRKMVEKYFQDPNPSWVLHSCTEWQLEILYDFIAERWSL